MLCATAPSAMAGKPIHFVPTMAHCSAKGQARPYTSSTALGPCPGVHVWPPSSLDKSSPLAGTTSLTVVAVVPAASHSDGVGQATLWRTPIPAGTEASAHVCPPSVLSATAPAPWPLPVGT